MVQTSNGSELLNHLKFSDFFLTFSPTITFQLFSYSEDPSTTVQKRHPLYANCDAGNPVKPVIFVKTHKTGSSTFTNIIMRHADNYNLRTGLPPEGKWELGAYPAKLNKDFIEPYDLKEYDVMSHHFRLDPKALKEVVPADTRVITILRDHFFSKNLQSVYCAPLKLKSKVMQTISNNICTLLCKHH